jgi:hypothetical protein
MGTQMISGKSVYHCHSPNKGKLIRKFKTVGEAKQFHYMITHPQKWRKK